MASGQRPAAGRQSARVLFGSGGGGKRASRGGASRQAGMYGTVVLWEGWTEGGVDELPCCAQPACLLCVRAVELCFPAAVLLLCSVGVVVDLRYGNCKGGAWCCVCYRPRRTNERSTVRAWVGDRNATLLAMRLRLPARPAQRHSACPTLCQSAHRNRRTIAAAAAAASETTATGQPARLARRGHT